MRHHGRLVFVGLFVAAVLAASTSALAAPEDFSEPEYVLPSLSEAVNLEFGPTGRVYVARQNGFIHTAASVDSTTSTVIWDGRDETHNYWDRGMLGMALHPDFPEHPYLYVLYTHGTPLPPLTRAYEDSCPTPPGPTGDGCVVSGKLVRIELNQTGTARVGEPFTMIHDWCQQFPSHSIGDLAFGADGALYVSAGDGASFNGVDWGQFGGSPGSPTPVNPCGDPNLQGGALRAQDLLTAGDPVTPDGAVLRIDPLYDPSDPQHSQLALPSNPNIGHSDPAGKLIVAHGLRNPFRMTFRPGTNELYIADVGWGLWEELNLHPSPTSSVRNYGWPCYEGGMNSSSASTSIRQPGYDNANLPICESLYSNPPSNLTPPLYAYHHNTALTDRNGTSAPNPADACPPAAPPAPVSSSITGLAFYEGGNYPSDYVGALFGGDYSRDCIWIMFPDESGRPDPSTVDIFHQQPGLGPVDLEMGPDGNMYFVNRSIGRIGRFSWTGTNTRPVAVINASPMSGAAPLQVTLDASDSFDPDGHPIVAYEWDLDGNGSFETTGEVVDHTFGPGSHTVRLRVRDFPGLLSTVDTVAINASNTAPSVQITTPSANTTWAVNQTISFSATATDPEEGNLPADRFRWDLVLHHCTSEVSCHDHHVESWENLRSGSFSAPDHGYPSYLELKVEVTDQYGLTATDSVELHPRTVRLRLESQPTGVSIGIGEDATTAPYEVTVIVGSRVVLSAPLTHNGGGQVWSFSHWSQGGPNNQTFVAPATNTTLTAHYGPALKGDGVGLADPSTGKWYLRDPQTGETTSFFFGNPGDIPLMGDWNCDGVATPGLYRQSDGFVYLRNSNTQGVADISFYFGNPGDIPIAGDFDGDGCDSVSIYRPSEQRIYIINKLGSNGGGLGVAEFSYIFGNPGDKPFVGDFDGDGIDTIGLHRESTGLVYFRNTHTQGIADAQFIYGNPGDRLVAGKWAEAGNLSVDTVAVFRPSTGTMYLKFSNTQGVADLSFPYGSASMWPVAGNFGVLPGGSAPPK